MPTVHTAVALKTADAAEWPLTGVLKEAAWLRGVREAARADVTAPAASDLSGMNLLLDYGETARFFLTFSHDATVEVTIMTSDMYSVYETTSFAVTTEERSTGCFEIGWADLAGRSRILHEVNFTDGTSRVTIVDDLLEETRTFVGTVAAA